MLKYGYYVQLQGIEPTISYADSVTLDSLLRVSDCMCICDFSNLFSLITGDKKDEKSFIHNSYIRF